jgi:hypothetical protein
MLAHSYFMHHVRRAHFDITIQRSSLIAVIVRL